MIIARLATEADRQAIIDLSRIGVAESYPDDEFLPQMISAIFDQYLMRANPTFFVADDRRKVVGFVKASMNPYDWKSGLYTTIEVVFVSPDYRGTRAATLLMREFDRWSGIVGAVESFGGNDNRRGTELIKKLFQHHGFENVGAFMRKRRVSDG